MSDPGAPGPTLLSSVAAGEPGAVERCLDAFGPLVWGLALRFSPDRAEAEDAVQEIFVDVWRSAGRYDPTLASEKGFVALIARRRLMDRRRHRDRRPSLVALPDGVERESGDQKRMERAVDFQDAVRALSDLRPDHREWIEMSLLQGLTHTEIAERTGVPLGTVKTGIRRGLIAVRSKVATASGEAH